MGGKIFISYRRDDSAGYAGRLHDRLAREFGRELLFMDVDAIPLGPDRFEIGSMLMATTKCTKRGISWFAVPMLLMGLITWTPGTAKADGQLRALLVGVSSYQQQMGFKPLNGPANDVALIADQLGKLGFHQENVVILADAPGAQGKPTREVILRELDAISFLTLFKYHGYSRIDAKEFCRLDPPFTGGVLLSGKRAPFRIALMIAWRVLPTRSPASRAVNAIVD